MSEKIFIKPKKGLKVREPLTGLHLPHYGKGVGGCSFWLRRLEDGDVVKTSAAEIAKAKAAEAKAVEPATKEKE